MKIDVSLGNVPSMTANGVVESLTSMYCRALERGEMLHKLPSVMLWGPPGAGKSQAIQQLAEQIGKRSGRRVKVTDVRLLLFNPIDLRGIPTANENRTLAVWLRPQIFQMDDADDMLNILFLDELSAAPQSVQAAAYQVVLDHVIGEHRLPDNCVVIAAGNRTTDKSVAFKMPRALANRLLHIEIEVDFESWRQWAVSHGVNAKIVGFLSFRQANLMQSDSSSNDLAFPTPRSWEMVSNLLNTVDDSVERLYTLIAGLVGTGAAIELRTWEKVYGELPSIEDIFDGAGSTPPKSTDALYALVSAMTTYAREHRNEMSRIANSIRYAQQLPPDYAVVLMKDYLAIEEGYRERLLAIPEFVRWLEMQGRFADVGI